MLAGAFLNLCPGHSQHSMVEMDARERKDKGRNGGLHLFLPHTEHNVRQTTVLACERSLDGKLDLK